MNILAILVPPVLGGIIALSTNWIAIKMLFRPLNEKRIFGLRVPFTPGLIPKERDRLAKKLGEAISTHLLTPDVLADKLADPSVWPLPDSTVGEALMDWGIENPEEYIAAAISGPAKKAVDAFLPKAIGGLINLPERFPALDEKLAALTAGVASKSINPFAGLFVRHEKIYNNIKEAVFTYLSEPDNQEELRLAIHKAIDTVMAADAVSLKDAVSFKLPLAVGDVVGNVIEDEGVAEDSGATKVVPDVDKSETPREQQLAQYICGFHIREGAQILFTREPYASAIRRILEVAASYLATHMPVAQMIEQKLANLDVAETEKVLLSVVGRELKLIIWLGGLFGTLIGIMSLFMQL